MWTLRCVPRALAFDFDVVLGPGLSPGDLFPDGWALPVLHGRLIVLAVPSVSILLYPQQTKFSSLNQSQLPSLRLTRDVWVKTLTTTPIRSPPLLNPLEVILPQSIFFPHQ